MSCLFELQRPVVLFDLDGTLLPMDYDTFERKYFGGLCAALPDLDPQKLVTVIWDGVKAMVRNDGARPNRDAFADAFSASVGMDYYEREEEFLRYYHSGFQTCREVCDLTDLSGKIVDVLQEKGYTVAIATNPLFPQVATYSRLRWLGIEPERFPLVTTFENSGTAKPNPAYYLEVCSKLGVSPSECIMIGNDMQEDGIAASVGMEVVIVRECLINRKDREPEGLHTVQTLQDVLNWANALPSLT